MKSANPKSAAEIDALTARLILIESECHRLQDEDARLREEADQTAPFAYGRQKSPTPQESALQPRAEAEIENARAELLSQTAMAERLREIARQLEGTLEPVIAAG